MAAVANRSAIILASLVIASIAAGAAAYFTGIATTLATQLAAEQPAEAPPQTLIYSITTTILSTEIVFITAFGVSRHWLGKTLRGEDSSAEGLTDTAVTFIGFNTLFLLASILILA